MARKRAVERHLSLEASMIGVHGGNHFGFPREWLKRRAFGPTGLVLVRPDHFIAWRPMELEGDPETRLSAARDQILSRACLHLR